MSKSCLSIVIGSSVSVYVYKLFDNISAQLWFKHFSGHFRGGSEKQLLTYYSLCITLTVYISLSCH